MEIQSRGIKAHKPLDTDREVKSFRTFPNIRINFPDTKTQEDAVGSLLRLSKKADVSPTKYQEAVEKVNATLPEERSYSGAEVLLKKAGELVGKLKELARIKEDNLLKDSQKQGIATEQEAIQKEFEKIRSGKEFQNLTNATDTAIKNIDSGNAIDFLSQNAGQREFLGDGFFALVANGDSKALQTVKAGLSAISGFDLANINSSKTLGDLEKKINSALQTLRSATNTPTEQIPDAAKPELTEPAATLSAGKINLEILKSSADSLKDIHALDADSANSLLNSNEL